MFDPPRCPNRRCSQHSQPTPRFFVRKGSYAVDCRSRPVPRFRCRSCGRGFSRQTFRMDYRDHKPDLNARVFLSLATGLGLRQTGRNVGLSLRCTEMKFRKIGRHLRRLNLNLRGPLSDDASFQLDELETFEGCRGTRPLSLPMLIEEGSRLIIWGESASIRPSGGMSKARRRAIHENEMKHGKRRHCSHVATARTLRRGAAIAVEMERVLLLTDEKSSYPKLAREAFGEERLVHERTNSKLARGSWNPLFPINHTDAMARDHIARLRRQSWLASKKRRYLDLGVQIWMAYRNYVRRRFNYDDESPAQILGFVDRRMSAGELLSWRQDWRRESIHPLSRSCETVESWMRRHSKTPKASRAA